MSWIDCLGILGVITPVLAIFGMIAWKAEQRATARREDWERRFRHEAGTQMVEQLVGSNAQVEADNPAAIVARPGPFVRPDDILFLYRYQPIREQVPTDFIDGVFVTKDPSEWRARLELHNETSNTQLHIGVSVDDLRQIGNGFLAAADRLGMLNPDPRVAFLRKPTLPPPHDLPKRRSMWDRLKGDDPFDD